MDQAGGQVNPCREETYVATLREAIRHLGGTPVDEGVYEFGYKDVPSFLAVAHNLESALVAAYDDDISAIADKTFITSVARMLSIEGRHSPYINIRNAISAFPTAAGAAQMRPEILAAVAPFITSQ